MGNFLMNRKTQFEFEQEVFELVKYEYDILGRYVTNKTKINVKHNICGNEYMVTPNEFLRGRRCPHCYGNLKKDTTQFKKDIYDMYRGEYELLSEYISSAKKVKIRHVFCGHEYDILAKNFLKGVRCPKCYGGAKYTHIDFEEKMKKIHGNRYEILSTYVNVKTKILVKDKVTDVTKKLLPCYLLSRKKEKK